MYRQEEAKQLPEATPISLGLKYLRKLSPWGYLLTHSTLPPYPNPFLKDKSVLKKKSGVVWAHLLFE